VVLISRQFGIQLAESIVWHAVNRLRIAGHSERAMHATSASGSIQLLHSGTWLTRCCEVFMESSSDDFRLSSAFSSCATVGTRIQAQFLLGRPSRQAPLDDGNRFCRSYAASSGVEVKSSAVHEFQVRSASSWTPPVMWV